MCGPDESGLQGHRLLPTRDCPCADCNSDWNQRRKLREDTLEREKHLRDIEFLNQNARGK